MGVVKVQGVVPREETPLAGTKVPDNVHECFLKTKESSQDYHPVKLYFKIGEIIDNTPDTVSSINLGSQLRKHGFLASSVRNQMLHFHGSWVRDDPYSGAGLQVANPKSPHVTRYSDCPEQCECGTIVVHYREMDNIDSDLPHDSYNDHKDGCLPQWRLIARGNMLENRRRAFEQMIFAGHTASECRDRIGIDEGWNIARMANRVGAEVSELREKYMDARVNTMVELMPLYDKHEIGDIYGVKGSFVRQIIGSNTEYNARDFKPVRKENRDQINEENLLVQKATA